jgi:uncharacterized protein YabN with tetrapyrrole methylase and pyrophosphatase domain
MSDGPALILAGYGTGDALQLTIEAQQAIARATAVYAIAPPERLVRHLGAQRIRVVDLGPRLQSEGLPVEAYLDVAGFLLREASLDPPVALLAPGNPLFLNSLTRFLVQAARERELEVALFPGVSVIDALISDLGLDVTARGLQVFDARHLLARQQAVQPHVPLFVLQTNGLAAAASDRGLDVTEVTRAFAAHLGRFYPPVHPVSLVLETTGRGHFRHDTRPLSEFEALAPELEGSVALFCDVVRDG